MIVVLVVLAAMLLYGFGYYCGYRDSERASLPARQAFYDEGVRRRTAQLADIAREGTPRGLLEILSEVGFR